MLLRPRTSALDGGGGACVFLCVSCVCMGGELELHKLPLTFHGLQHFEGINHLLFRYFFCFNMTETRVAAK